MKNLLAMIVLGSISMGALAEEIAESPVFQNVEIDVVELNREQKERLELEREQYRLAIAFEQNEKMNALFAAK